MRKISVITFTTGASQIVAAGWISPLGTRGCERKATIWAALFTTLVNYSVDLLFAFLFLLLPMVSWSQMDDVPASLGWGSLQKAPPKSQLAKILYARENGVLALRHRNEGLFSSEQFWLEQYDESFNLQARNELAIGEDQKIELEDLFYWQGMLYLISSRPLGEDNVNSVFIRPISKSGQLQGTERLIAEIPQEDKFRKRQFDLKFSKDSSFVLLYNQLPPEKNGPERFTLRVFDPQFNLLWSRDVNLPFRDKDYSILEYQIDEEGNVFILGKRRRIKNGQSLPGVFSLYAYTNTGKTEAAYFFELDDIVFHQLTFNLSNKGHLVCGGIYSMAEDINNFGLFHIDVDVNSQSIEPVKMSPFLEKSEKNITNRKDLPGAYRLRDLVLRSDGGVVVIAEQYDRFNRKSVTYQGLQTETYFMYNDILVANLTPEGEFSWLKRIPKIQLTTNDDVAFSSFAQATVQDRFYFIYNDNPDNFRPSNDRQHNVNHHSSVVSLTEIKRDGSVITIPLFVNKDAGIITRPKLCRQIGAKSMLVYGDNRRDYRFGLLKFE